MPTPLPISGYILAGGRSSRMGRDKALIELAGQPLIARAVTKLRRICADVHILSNNPALAGFATAIPDLHPNRGPLGGIEAALAQTSHDWNLFLPVDMPFLPTACLFTWARSVVAQEQRGTRIGIFTADGRSHPALCLLHRDIEPFISEAIAQRELALHSVFDRVGRELADRLGIPLTQCLINTGCSPEVLTGASPRSGNFQANNPALQRSNPDGQPSESHPRPNDPEPHLSESDPHTRPWSLLTDAQQAAKPLWFLNLNTPDDLALAEANTAALDT